MQNKDGSEWNPGPVMITNFKEIKDSVYDDDGKINEIMEGGILKMF